MIRQARSYLAGAVSGTVLIAAAVIAVVVLVSAQAFRSWPLAEFGAGGEKVSVEPARPAAAPAPGAIASRAQTAVERAANDGGAQGPSGGKSAVKAPDIAQQESAGGGSGAGGGADSGTPGGSAGTGGGQGSSTAPSNTSAGGGSSEGGAAPSQPQPTTPSPSATVVDTVNETVKGVDAALGGTLSQTGLPGTAQGLAKGLAGPGSAAGRGLDKAAAAVKGLLSPHD